jgi:cytochrome oxidase Cu insertion factor (SCO1/SenC/PrrC family)
MLQFSIGKVMFRDRTKSVAEEINGVHEGDAAFANYVWMAGYTLRLPGRRSAAEAALGTNSIQLAKVAGGKAAAGRPNTFKPFALKTLDGEKKSLKDFSNKVTLVSFFFPQCPYCNVELPLIQKMYDKYKDIGLSAVWINIVPEEEAQIADWRKAKNLSVPVLIGASQESLLKDYAIDATPTTYLLDENGAVLYRADGYKPGDERVLETKIAAVLTRAAAASASLPPCPERPEDLPRSGPDPRIPEARQ